MNRAAAVQGPAGVKISGTGVCIPDRILTNDDLARMVDTSDDWIAQRTGISQRRIIAEGMSAAELGAGAVKQALGNAGLEPRQLDLLLCATMTPDMVCPATSCQIVERIGAVPCGAMDISIACTGFVAALNTAVNFVKSGMFRHVAVVGVEVLSRVVDWKDRSTCILFGDGAGAAIVSASDDAQQGCIYQMMASDGGRWGELYMPRQPSDIPEGGVFNGSFNKLQMNGREVYKFAVTTFQEAIKQAMDACDLTAAQVKMVIPHQSNRRIIESAREKLGFSEDKVYINIDRFGNTSAASVALCLHEVVEAGRLARGDNVIFVAFGAGLAWASSVWRF